MTVGARAQVRIDLVQHRAAVECALWVDVQESTQELEDMAEVVKALVLVVFV